VCSKAIASETKVLPFMDEVQIPADDYSSKDCSLYQMSVNTAIFNGDYDNIGVIDYKVEERSVSHAEKISAGSIQILENESMLDATDRSTRTGFQMPEEVDIVRNSNACSGKIECLDKLGCNILPEVDMNGSDGGENNIISNILSLNFDTDDTSLNSPRNLAKLLLFGTSKCNGRSYPSDREEDCDSWTSSCTEELEGFDGYDALGWKTQNNAKHLQSRDMLQRQDKKGNRHISMNDRRCLNDARIDGENVVDSCQPQLQVCSKRVT
jgi:hypothetical protein